MRFEATDFKITRYGRKLFGMPAIPRGSKGWRRHIRRTKSQRANNDERPKFYAFRPSGIEGTNMNDWAVGKRKDGTMIVHPRGDLRRHLLEDSETKPCWCHPFWDSTVWVHRSVDQRETYERGRKPQ